MRARRSRPGARGSLRARVGGLTDDVNWRRARANSCCAPAAQPGPEAAEGGVLGQAGARHDWPWARGRRHRRCQCCAGVDGLRRDGVGQQGRSVSRAASAASRLLVLTPRSNQNAGSSTAPTTSVRSAGSASRRRRLTGESRACRLLCNTTIAAAGRRDATRAGRDAVQLGSTDPTAPMPPVRLATAHSPIWPRVDFPAPSCGGSAVDQHQSRLPDHAAPPGAQCCRAHCGLMGRAAPRQRGNCRETHGAPAAFTPHFLQLLLLQSP